MKTRRMHTFAVQLATLPVLAAALLLSACSGGGGGAGFDRQAEEEALRERAQARWEAIIAGDFEQVHQFGTAEYREQNTVQRVQTRYTRGTRRAEVKVLDVFFSVDDPSRATVLVKQLFDTRLVHNIGGDPVAQVDEIWEKRDGQWWYARYR